MTAKTTARLLLLVLLVLSGTASPGFGAGSHSDAHFEAGLKAFTAEDYLKAAEELTQSLQSHPTAKAALYLGNAYLKLGQLGKAKEALEQVLQIDPATNRRELIIKLVQGIESRNVGVVKISSTPAGATIYLDEKDARGRGKAPIELSLPPGKHRVIAELAGYESTSQEVVVTFGETTELALALRTVGCDLALSATAPGGRAVVDGGAAVAVPATVRVAPGEHRVAFSAAGFQTQELPVRCATAPLALSATLIAAPAEQTVARQTGLAVTVNVPNTTLTLDGAPLATGKPQALAAGSHRLHASAPGYRPLSTQLTLPDGEVLQAEVHLVRPSWHALGAAVSLTALAATAEVLALVAHSQAAAAPVGSPAYGSSQDTALGLHIAAGALAAGAIVGYALEFALVRSSLNRRAERGPRPGVAALPHGGALTLAGRF